MSERLEQFWYAANSKDPNKWPQTEWDTDYILVGQADIGQTRGADLRHPTYDFSYSHPLMPVCPGHYNHMYMNSNPRIGMWYPRLDENQDAVLVWFGNSFKIAHESECIYCLHSAWRNRDGVRSLESIDPALKSR